MEGYLIHFERSGQAVVRYVVVEEGYVICYAAADQKSHILYQYALTGHHLKVELIPDGYSREYHHRFQISTRKIIEENGQQRFALDTKSNTMIFASACRESKLRWANYILNWNRHVFDTAPASRKDLKTFSTLKMIVQTHAAAKPTSSTSLRYYASARSHLNSHWLSQRMHSYF